MGQGVQLTEGDDSVAEPLETWTRWVCQVEADQGVIRATADSLQMVSHALGEPVGRHCAPSDQVGQLRPPKPRVRGSLIDGEGIRVRVGRGWAISTILYRTVGPPGAGFIRSQEGESWTAVRARRRGVIRGVKRRRRR